jgi:hypothetical protein
MEMICKIDEAMRYAKNTREAADYLGIPIRKLRYYIKRDKKLCKYHDLFLKRTR